MIIKQLISVDFNKLLAYHLNFSHVLFPPKIWCHSGTKSTKAIIDVHDNMHKTVDEGKEGAVTTRRKLDTPPHAHGHNTMVNDM